MKRFILFITLVTSTLALYSQKDPVNDLFEKYSGKKGFTTVYISGKMFEMFSKLESKEPGSDNIMGTLKSIRILSVEDTMLNRGINFYTELSRNMDFSKYEELMVVNDSKGTTKFLVKPQGKTVSELLMITGGKEGNALISIRGDLDLKTLSGLSKTMGIEQLENLDKLDQKNVKK